MYKNKLMVSLSRSLDMRIISYILVLVGSFAVEAYALDKLCPGVQSLAEDRVPILFEHLAHGEKVESTLLVRALNGPQMTLRAYAATALGDNGHEAIPYLIDALSDESIHVGAQYAEAGLATTRYRANASLKKLTGKDFGFVWNASDRENAIRSWARWYQAEIALEQVGGRDAMKRCRLH